MVMNKQYKRIGILGGSFNPPHIAHVVNAEFVGKKLNLDKVFLMPSAISPHQDKKETIASHHREKMVNLAIENNDLLAIETYEIERGGKNYTYDTIQALKKKYSGAQIYFIIGGDMVEYLPTWYKIDELVQMVQFVGIHRIGYSLETHYNVQLIEVPSIDISSSKIRQYIDNDEPIRYLIDDKVLAYIQEHNLYQSESDLVNIDFEALKEIVKSQMSYKRFEHVLRVEQKAIELAKQYRVNVLACRLAALLHDLCKEWTMAQYEAVVNQFNLDKDLLNWGSEILHGIVAKYVVPEMFFEKKNDELNSLEQQIVDAIACHTVGSKQMSDVAKVLFVADYIEDGRSFDGVDTARELAKKSLTKAIQFKLEHTIQFLKEKQVPIYPVTEAVYQHWCLEK